MRRTSSSCALCRVASREGQRGVHSEPQGNCRPAVNGGSACVACSCFTGENQSCRHLFDSTRQLLQGHQFALGGDVLALFRPHSANRFELEDAGCAIQRTTLHERRSLLRSCTLWDDPLPAALGTFGVHSQAGDKMQQVRRETETDADRKRGTD